MLTLCRINDLLSAGNSEVFDPKKLNFPKMEVQVLHQSHFGLVEGVALIIYTDFLLDLVLVHLLL
jgi:hypothetical protein